MRISWKCFWRPRLSQKVVYRLRPVSPATCKLQQPVEHPQLSSSVPAVGLAINQGATMTTVLSCDPSNEIVFAIDPSKKMLQTFVTLRNPSDTAHLAFSVKTTQPSKYAVRPPQGVLAPRQTLAVTVLMSNRKPPVALGLQKQDKFLFQYGEVPAGTTDEAAKDVLKNSDAQGASTGLKLRVRLKDLPRAPSTISEGLHEGHTADEPGTPSKLDGSDDASLPSPLHRKAQEVNELEGEVARLRASKQELQASTEQLRLLSNAPSNNAPNTKAKRSTSDSIARARQGPEGFGLFQLIFVAIFAILLGILSRVVSRENLGDILAAVREKF